MPKLVEVFRALQFRGALANNERNDMETNESNKKTRSTEAQQPSIYDEVIDVGKTVLFTAATAFVSGLCMSAGSAAWGKMTGPSETTAELISLPNRKVV